ncbi:MAG: glycosyltransferase family 4 protein [Verrucomicrobiota bacterium]|nr:glycosyltransferase family 4 protein [Verrucomicrobiota bacterium]
MNQPVPFTNRPPLSAATRKVAIACCAPFGTGGLGRHLQEVVEYYQPQVSTEYFCLRPLSRDPHGHSISLAGLRLLQRWSPLRFYREWQIYFENRLFDRAVASRQIETDLLICFNGQALTTFRHARASARILAAANSHFNLTARKMRQAFHDHPIEPIGYLRGMHQRFLAEYELASGIYYSSNYTRESFVQEGISPGKLTRFDLTPASRFVPPNRREKEDIFRVVYVGSLSVTKGVQVLIRAFQSFQTSPAELLLIGGSGTRQMNRFLQQAVRSDPRIQIRPGDPLPCLQQADVCVHPSYNDGLAYAGLEALACGVPVIASGDTGMKELIRPGINGWIVPTGDSAAILEKLIEVHQHPLAATYPLLPSRCASSS